jgi:predicted membrane protein
MKKHELLKLISKIHAIKCWKTEDFNLAVNSFKQLIDFKNAIIAEEETNLILLEAQIENWTNDEPMVSTSELNNKI